MFTCWKLFNLSCGKTWRHRKEQRKSSCTKQQKRSLLVQQVTYILNSSIRFRSATSRVSTTFARQWPGLARQRHWRSAGAHANDRGRWTGTVSSAPWPTSFTESNCAGDAPGPCTHEWCILVESTSSRDRLTRYTWYNACVRVCVTRNDCDGSLRNSIRYTLTVHSRLTAAHYNYDYADTGQCM